MDAQTLGPLVGVVIGAVLGGGAQIVDSHLSARRNRKNAQREVRRSVYVELIRICSQVNQDAVAMHIIKGDNREFMAMLASLTALQSARAELSLVAPADTDKAGQVMADLHLDLGAKVGDSDDVRKKIVVARDLFLTYAQRDLDYGEGLRQPTPKKDA